jgi:diaminopimelate decarboxylase
MAAELPAHGGGHVRDLVSRHFACADGQLVIGGVPVSALVARHGTPLYVYDMSVVRRQWQLLRDTLPARFGAFYSVKANPAQVLLRFFVARGAGLEVASAGELHQALAAGCPAERIVFAGPGKCEEELALALDAGIGEIHVESATEARRIAALAASRGRPARIALRVNPAAAVEGGGMRMGGRAVQFGIDEDQLDDVLGWLAGERWLRLVGLHLFMGTQILDHGTLLAQYAAGLDIARRIAPACADGLETLDFGGGWGVPYFAHERRLDTDALRAGLAELVEGIATDPVFARTRFFVEPGRFLVAEAGVYLAGVVDVKTSRGKTFVVVDGGMHQHLAASGNLGQTIKRNFPLAVVNRLDSAPSGAVDVVGPLCTPLDTLARAVELPQAAVGDIVGVFQSGAYGRSASPLGFLGHPAPPEVAVEDGRDRLVRRRGRVEDWLADQMI